MAKIRSFQILGFILLIAGVGVLVYGLTTINNIKNSNKYKIPKALGLQQNTDDLDQATMYSVLGGAGIVVGAGFILIKPAKRGKRRRR